MRVIIESPKTSSPVLDIEFDEENPEIIRFHPVGAPQEKGEKHWDELVDLAREIVAEKGAPPKEEVPSDVVTVSDAAARRSLPAWKFYDAIRGGKLRGWKIDGRWMVREEESDQVVKATEPQPQRLTG